MQHINQYSLDTQLHQTHTFTHRLSGGLQHKLVTANAIPSYILHKTHWSFYWAVHIREVTQSSSGKVEDWFVPGRTAAVRFKQVWPFKFSQAIAGTQNRRIHLRFFWSTARRQQQRVGGQTCRCRLLKLKADTCSSHQKCTHPSMFSSSTDMWFCSICTACLYCLLKQAVF